jgi:hypothetical protein
MATVYLSVSVFDFLSSAVRKRVLQIPFFQWDKSVIFFFNRVIIYSIYPHATRLQKCMKNFEAEIAKLEAGEFKNRFLPCYFGILEDTYVSTKERDSRQIELLISSEHQLIARTKNISKSSNTKSD